MPENNYTAMADLFRDGFGSRRVAIFPLDHGGAVQASRLQPYLRDAGVNFVPYERSDNALPEENCIDQGNLYKYEVRQIVTPRRKIKRFLREKGNVDDVVVLDDWATSKGMPSLGGGYAYFAELGYPNVKTAVFRDRCGGADITPDRRSEHQYRGTRDYLRKNDPGIYFYLLGNYFLPPEEDDSLFLKVLDEIGWLERSRLYLTRRADQIVVTPMTRRLRGDFIKDLTDRALRAAAIL